MIGLLKKILFYLSLIAAWELIYELGVNVLHLWKSYVFPSPLSVFKTLWELCANASLFIALVTTMRRMIIGYAISVVIGAVLGVLITRMKHFGDQFNSLVLGMQSLPSICWLPFAILWFGITENSVIFVTAIGSTFAIAIAVESGIKNVDPLFLRAAKTMGARGITIYRDVVLPASLPSLVSGLKQGWSFAWRALMAGEMLSASKGLGVILMQGRDFADISQVMAMMLVIIALGLLVDKFIFGKVETNVRRRWGLDRN